MRKRVLALVVLLLLFSSVAANAQWKGTITMWDAPKSNEEGDKFRWIKEKMAEFTEKHPGVKFELVEVPWAEMNEKLSISIAGRSWPDIAPIDENSVVPIQFIEQGVLEPITKYYSQAELDDILPAAKDAYSYKGELYGAPKGMSVHTMLLNKDIFAERGVELPANGVWTWDEFVEKMKALTFDRNGDGVTDVYGFSTYILSSYYEAWPILMMDGANPLNENGTEYTFNSPETVTALQKLVDLKFKHGVSPVEMGSADVGGTFQAFANTARREVAVEPWSSWALASLAPGSKYEMDFAVAEYPVGERGSSVSISGVHGYMVFRQRDAEKTKMITEFLKTITSKDEQLYAAGKWSAIPVSVAAHEANPFEQVPALQRAAEIAQTAITVPRHRNWAQIESRVQAELQLALNGDKTPEQALNDAAKSVSSIISVAK